MIPMSFPIVLLIISIILLIIQLIITSKYLKGLFLTGSIMCFILTFIVSFESVHHIKNDNNIINIKVLEIYNERDGTYVTTKENGTYKVNNNFNDTIITLRKKHYYNIYNTMFYTEYNLVK